MSVSVSQFRFAKNRLYVQCRLKPESDLRCSSAALFFCLFACTDLTTRNTLLTCSLLTPPLLPPSVYHPDVSGRAGACGAIVLLGTYCARHCAVFALGWVCDDSAFFGCDVLAVTSFSPPHCRPRSACYSPNSNCSGRAGPNRCPCGTRASAGARHLWTRLIDSLSASARGAEDGGIYSVEAPTGCLHPLAHQAQCFQ